MFLLYNFCCLKVSPLTYFLICGPRGEAGSTACIDSNQHPPSSLVQAELFDRFRQQAASNSAHMGPDSGGKPQPTEEEAADANQRNRAISSSAINRALADANSGTCMHTHL